MEIKKSTAEYDFWDFFSIAVDFFPPIDFPPIDFPPIY